ncbi:hypothetical protein MTR67_036230 [Solanum verrucosum]|uniref:DUF4218 domain-containing protein n=1 Tax=Solanum verrucosum TaxID=315347 RepID=A0AAF0ZMD8_SOLVR|nr:hypothetical protein MTR67_036230 [Solanum verrucosum]
MLAFGEAEESDSALVDDDDKIGEDNEEDEIHDILRDLHPVFNVDNMNKRDDDVLEEEPNPEAKRFYSLLKDFDQPLYEGSKVSKLSTLVKLLHIKSIGHWSNNSFNMLLKMLKKDLLPDESNLPDSYYEARKLIKSLGISYDRIDACRNDCMLYWKNDKFVDSCKICGASRWKEDKHNGETKFKKGKKIPYKILRYFPLKTRLQRLFMSSKRSPLMRWHHENKANDGIMRHPVDSKAWKKFDELHQSFVVEPRNVRLGLASDGFQPFGCSRTPYSIWPVVLIPYNLPPWLCMKQENFILSMLIPGPGSPGDAIDVYLQPLIDELKELWETEVCTFDASTKQNFTLYAALLWTINDFPAYGNLSGWSTKGKLACPCCNRETFSIRLTNGKKQCYMGHRHFLPLNHKWRNDKKSFDGTVERRLPPNTLSGDDILDQVVDLDGLPLTNDQKKKVFIPAFFDVMEHLPIHLANEAMIGGPVQYRSMYPVERWLYFLKLFIRNRSCVEGSIAEGYIANEFTTLCSRYLHTMETKFNLLERNYDGGVIESDGGLMIFCQPGKALKGGKPHLLDLKEMEQAHIYILKNCDEVQPFLEEFSQIPGDSSKKNLIGNSSVGLKKRGVKMDEYDFDDMNPSIFKKSEMGSSSKNFKQSFLPPGALARGRRQSLKSMGSVRVTAEKRNLIDQTDITLETLRSKSEKEIGHNFTYGGSVKGSIVRGSVEKRTMVGNNKGLNAETYNQNVIAQKTNVVPPGFDALEDETSFPNDDLEVMQQTVRSKSAKENGQNITSVCSVKGSIETSTRNAMNRSKLSMPHRTGSKPIREIVYELGGKHGNPPDMETIFFETRKKDNKLLEPKTNQKYEEIQELLQVEPSLTNIEVVERCFGPQSKSYVVGFGGGITSKDLKGGSSAKVALLEQLNVSRKEKAALLEELNASRKENESMKRRMDNIEKRCEMFESTIFRDPSSPPSSSEQNTD